MTHLKKHRGSVAKSGISFGVTAAHRTSTTTLASTDTARHGGACALVTATFIG